MALFTGSGVAIVTPFTSTGDVNFNKLEELINWHIDNKTDSIVICGTTGEASTLNDKEHLACIELAVDVTNKRVPVIAGTGSNDTAHGINLSKEAEKLGADALLHVTPYYNKTTQRGLLAHYGAIASSVDIPIILYNVPSRTGMGIEAKTVAELFKIENITGLKEASGNISNIMELMQRTNGEIDLYSGNDDQILPLLSAGGKGVISVVANILPEQTHNIVEHYFNGDIAKSRQLQFDMLPLIINLFSETNPIPIKEAMNMMGMDAGPCRLPLYDMDPEKAAVLRQVMIDFGIEVK